MNSNEISLAQAAAKIEENGQTVKAGNFDSFADFLSYYNRHYKPLLRAIRDGEDITTDRRRLLNFMADDLIKLFWDEEDSDESEEEDKEDPTLTESQKRDTLCRLWDAAWQQAKADPKTYRVIVETNEQDPTAPDNEFGSYYMIDKADGCGNVYDRWQVIRVDTVTSPFEVHRPNWHHLNGYADSWTQLACGCENPNNVTRWARKMIDAGRVTDIYADCY